MNERGIVSLTGILILLMLAYLIRGTSFTAGTYVDMIRNFQVENKLQLDAQSKFDAILQNYEGKSFTDTELTEQIAADNEENGIQVRLLEGTRTIVILAVEKEDNHFNNGINAYRSVCGFLQTDPDGRLRDDGLTLEYQYKFGGFLHDNI